MFCDLDEDDGMIEVTSDDEVIYFLQVKKKTVVEARLTKEEKQQFDRAKDECLAPWIENVHGKQPTNQKWLKVKIVPCASSHLETRRWQMGGESERDPPRL